MKLKEKHNNEGFTLIEMLIAVAIVAILVSLAVPNYSRYVARGKLTAAQADVALVALKFENRYQRVLSYPTTAATDTAGLQALIPGWAPASESEDFNFTNVNPDAAGYTVLATGTSPSVAGCVISIDNLGNKTITNCASLVNDGKWL